MCSINIEEGRFIQEKNQPNETKLTKNNYMYIYTYAYYFKIYYFMWSILASNRQEYLQIHINSNVLFMFHHENIIQRECLCQLQKIVIYCYFE